MLKNILFFFLLVPFAVAAQINVNTQNLNYPVYSKLDSVKMAGIRNSNISDIEKEKSMRDYLVPFCNENDALACYLLAITYDKFPSGQGTKTDADTALKYYKKSADGKLADACYFLYQLYRYNFMNQPANEKLSMQYLIEAKKYGSVSIQTQCNRELAGIYYPRKENKNESDMRGVKPDLDSTKYYLSESLKIDSNDTWTLDFIGSIYEDEKNYAKAMSYYMKSTNANSKLQVANWLATGRKVKKDTQRAINIVNQVLDSMVKKDGYTPETIHEYMGVYNPAVLLNIFYKCYKIISKQELGKWYIGSVSCDDYAGIVNE